ncbi:Rho termination factor N-terminal domain-containing protein [Phenylobacterium sp. J426]|uniref:Rho termination factor N-terminal domain-containing protein n=1 Tax=Phenylobacterium sp. J426 TaxID=2898439 RepID=UPI0021516052|nr:Rho termination factor N-terminal domain-containing protein [Phenylobacterium sp. J426]MCR5874370.1 Rho termination factor N-terminal domain-containing protein [Phenylobacterium sp. J426]
MALKIINEFVDYRSGKRYAPGDKIEPALEAEQIERLVKANCLRETEGGGGAPAEDDLSSKTVDELKALAEAEGIDLAGATKKADIVAAVETALAERAA